MSKIINITLKADHNNNWSIGVVRDDNYAEITSSDTHEIDNEIKKIIAFSEKIKTKEEIELEEATKLQEETLKVVYNKTTLDERLKMLNILKKWQEGDTITKGDERTYNNVLYIAKKDHVASYDSIPINDMSYWKKAIATAELPDLYNHEKKYKINEKCVFNRRIWSSLITQEGQSPFASPQTWEDEGEV